MVAYTSKPAITEEAEKHHVFKTILGWNETLPLKTKRGGELIDCDPGEIWA